jgi:aminoglycoside phosphotransferase family enzyme
MEHCARSDAMSDAICIKALTAQRIGRGNTLPQQPMSRRNPDPSLAEKVAALSRADSYPGQVGRIGTLETHMSWVFLTDRHAYKLKKPVRLAFLDFSTVRARERDCREEIRLNRRLAPDTYLGVVPLTMDADGKPRLGGKGRVVDWLVEMRRLPSDMMLDQVIAAGQADSAVVAKVAGLLSRFYTEASPVALNPCDYIGRFEREIEEHRRELTLPDYEMPAETVSTVILAEEAFLRTSAGLLGQRVSDARIVEGHGDLRPEHVFVGDPPEVIDCLEFNKAFRIVDPADELAFLWMECALLGAPDVGEGIWRAYVERTGDAAPEALPYFYQSHRACLRAKLSLWHLRDHDVREPAEWRSRARRYLALAAAAVGHYA